MNYRIRILMPCMLILLSLVAGCGGSTKAPTVAEQFKRFLNLDAATLAIELTGEAETQFQDYLSKGYFTYTADAETLARIQQHSEFSEVSEFNQTIQPLNCSDSNYPTDFTYWTDAPVTTAEKACYMGIFFPYVHYLLHDPSSGSMQHFVTGMRD